MKVHAPSPEASAIRSRQASTILRALVRPFSRSPASSANVGTLSIAGSPCGCLIELAIVRNRLDLQIEQRGAQRFAMRVERQRSRDAAAQRLAHDKVQR